MKRNDVVLEHEQIKKSLAAVGITAEIHYHTNWSAFSKMVDDGKLLIFLWAWYADVPDPDNFLTKLFHSKSSRNFFGYANPAVDDLLISARTSGDAQRRVELYRRAEQMILDDAPVIPVSTTRTSGCSSRTSGASRSTGSAIPTSRSGRSGWTARDDPLAPREAPARHHSGHRAGDGGRRRGRGAHARVAIIDELQRRGEALVRNLAATSYGPLLLYNFTALEQTVVRAAAERDVVYAMVLDADGKVAAHSRYPERVGLAAPGRPFRSGRRARPSRSRSKR